MLILQCWNSANYNKAKLVNYDFELIYKNVNLIFRKKNMQKLLWKIIDLWYEKMGVWVKNGLIPQGISAMEIQSRRECTGRQGIGVFLIFSSD